MTPDQPSDGSERLHRRALETLPGGVSHNVRYFDPYPIYINRADGPYLWDADGNRYVDFWMNHMVSVLGHAYPEVVTAVKQQAERGLHYGAVNEQALELAERIGDYVPSAERVRFCSSGTEATMYAVRLARAHTDRSVILKALGGWHGGNTDLSGFIHTPFDGADTVGLPSRVMDDLYGFPVNDRETVDNLLEAHDVAAVIIEPMLLAGGGVRAREEFLQYLKDEREDRGFQLVFDEVVTGFRVSPGSYQARIGIDPDLTTLGKFLGGGLPVGALCGRAELFETARPDVEVPPDEQVLAGGGTFTANPMTAAAGLASLDVLEDEPVYEYTEVQAARVREELKATYEELGIDATVLGTSSMFLSHFQPSEPLEDAAAIETETNREALQEYHHRLLDHGYYFLPCHMGSVSYQTTEDQLDGFIDAAQAVVKELQSDGVL